MSESSTTSTDPSSLPDAQPRFEHFRIGDIDCYALSDGAMYRPSPMGQVTSDPAMVPLSCLLVRLPGNALTLIDTGFGIHEVGAGPGPSTVGHLTTSLAAAGFRPEDVDVVLISHLHPDHVGGMYDAEGRQIYPDAVYHMAADELAFWSRDPLDISQAASPPPIKVEMEEAAKRTLGHAAGTIRTFRAGDEVLPGLATMPLPGHAPGQVGFIVSSGNDRLLFTADAVTHPGPSIETPDMYNPMDMDPARAVKTRHEVIALLSQPGWQCFTQHFPWPSRGWIRETDDRATWEPASQA